MAAKLQGYQPQARAGERLPAATGASGAAAEAAGAAFGRLGARIGQIADEAAQRAGALEGQAAGAAAGEAREALSLRRDGTLRGEAADAAAIESYGWRLETRLREGVANAWTEHRDDPEALDKALGGLRGAFENEIGADPAIRESFGQRFSALAQPYRERAAERLLAQREAERAAAASEAVEAMMADVERRSYDAAGRPDETVAVGEEIRRVLSRIEEAGAQRALSPEDVRRAKQGLLARAETANLRGGFDSLEGDPEAQERYARNLVDLWARGELGGDALDLGAVRQIAGGMTSQARGEIQRRESEAAAAKAEAQRDLSELDKASALGVTHEREAEIRAAAAAVGLGAAADAAIARKGVERWLLDQPAAVRAAFIEQATGATVGDGWSLAAMTRWLSIDKSAASAEAQEARAEARLAAADRREAEREAKAEARLAAGERREHERGLQERLGLHRAALLTGAPYIGEEDLAAEAEALGGRFLTQYRRNLADAEQQRAFEAASPAEKARMVASRQMAGVMDRDGLRMFQEMRTATGAALKEEFGAYKDQADDLIAAYSKDRPLSWAEAWLNDPATPEDLKWRVRKAGLYSQQRRMYLDQGNSAEAAAALAVYREMTPETVEDIDAFEAFGRTAADIKRREEADPVQFVAEQKRVAFKPVSLLDPQSVRNRVADAEAARHHHNQGAAYFTEQERAGFQVWAETADRDARLAAVSTLVEGAGSAAHRVIADLGLEDRQLTHAAHLAASGSDKAARDVLRGQELRDQKLVETVPPADVQRLVARDLGSAFMLTNASALGDVREAALSIVAARQAATPGAAFDRLWQDAVMEASGGVKDRAGVWRGGVQEVNGVRTLLPTGMTSGEVQSRLRNLTPADLAAASLSGQPPQDADGALPSGRDLQIFATGDGVYALRVRARGGFEFMRDGGGGVYEMDLRRLMGARR